MPTVERAFALVLLAAALYFLVEAVRWALWDMAM